MAPASAGSRVIQWAATHQLAIGVLCLILCGWKFTFGLPHVLDLDLSWHEARYMAWVTGHAPLPVPPEYSPIYIAFYNLERLLVPDPVNLYFLNDAVVATLLPIGLFVFLSSRSVPFWLALPSSAYLMISTANLAVAPKPVHFGLTILFLSLALCSRLGERPVKWALLLVTAGALSLVRPEFLLSLLALTAYLGGRAVFERGARVPMTTALALAAPVIALLYWWGGAPLFNEKSIESFSEHFTLNYTSWHGFAGDPHTADYASIVRNVFGDIHSIPQAFFANPAVFLHHALTNIAHMPTTLAMLFLGHYNLLLPRFKLFTMAEAGLLGLALAVALCACRNSYTPMSIAHPLPGTNLLGRMRIRLSGFIREYPDTIPMACFLVPFPIMMTVLYPRYHYALGMGLIPIAFGLVVLGSRLRTGAPDWRGLLALPVLLLAIIPSLGSATPSFNARPGEMVVEPRPNLETVEFLRTLNPKSLVRLCQAGWMDPYLSDKFEPVQQERKAEGFNRFIAEQRISVLVADKRLRSDPRFSDDPEWTAFQKAPAALGFAAHPLPSGVVVYVKDDPSLFGN